jgi:PAS domain S-box-containing protein
MNPTSYREQLYETFTGTDADFEHSVERALDVGTEYLDLRIGFLTRIDDGVQEILIATGDDPAIQPGETCPIDEAYCRTTVETDGALSVHHAEASSAISDLALSTFGLGAYIGAKIEVDGDVFGTVCFADDARRAQEFDEAEEIFVELLARLIGHAYDRQAYERELEERNATLERERDRFEGIAENSADVLFRLDEVGNFTYVSSAVERVLDRDPAELVDGSFARFLDDAAEADALEAYERVMAGDSVKSIELAFLDDSGDRVLLEVNATPIRENADVVGVQGVGRDVTDRVERERELRIKNRAMDEASIGISISDARAPDDPLSYVNDGFERLTGYPEREALGLNCRYLQGPATDFDATATLREAIANGEGTTVDILNYRRDGTPFWNQLRVNPIHDDGGQLTHYLGFQEDVTGRKRTEQLLQLLNRVLRHNLRNDMNVVMGLSEMVAGYDDEDVADLGSRIERTAKELFDLSEQARKLEEHARSDRSPERIDPVELVERIERRQLAGTPSARIEWSVETDRDCCVGPEVETALSELFTNAIEHNDTSDPWVSVTVTDDGEWLEFVVEDNGPGIDEMESRVVASGVETAVEHGDGLGLWLVNWIVTRYGGSFQITARDVGDGTIATLRLPAIDEGTSIEAAERRPTVLFR